MKTTVRSSSEHAETGSESALRRRKRMLDDIQIDDFRESGSPEAKSSAREPSSEASAPAGAPLTEDLALARLADRDLSSEVVAEISRNSALMKSRKVRLALASHPRTPRRIALRLIRELYSFELMRFALMPTVAPDLRGVADELLLSRLASITLGERISLARRSSKLIAGALLLDKETPVWQTALDNGHLTESSVVKALQRSNATAALVGAVCHHAKWSVRPEVRIALLGNQHTPLSKALEFARHLPPAQLRDILHASRLPEAIKSYLRRDMLITEIRKLRADRVKSKNQHP